MRMIIRATIAACMALSTAAHADPVFPKLTGHVVDVADSIPDDQEATLAAELTAFEKRTGHQMVVLTVPDLEGLTKSQYADRIGRKWGLGGKDRDDGIVLLQSSGDGSPGSGRIHIAVGYGLEDILTDFKMDRIANEVMVPILKEKRPRSETTPEAIVAGARAVMKLANATTAEMKMATAREKTAAETSHRRAMATFWDAVLTLLGLGALGATGFGIWRFSTREERARKRAEEAAIAAQEELDRAEQRRLQAERYAAAAQAEREAAAARAQLERQRIQKAAKDRADMLAAMSPADRQALLDKERRQAEEAERRRKEQEERRRIQQEKDDAEERDRRKRQDEQDERDRQDRETAAAAAASSSSTWAEQQRSEPAQDSITAQGGDFGGGGGGAEY